MNRQVLLAVAGLLVSVFTACGGTGSQPSTPTPPATPSTFKETSPDPSGTVETFSQTQMDNSNPFFTPLGTNNRTCNSCHVASDGWSITPVNLQQTLPIHPGHGPGVSRGGRGQCP